MLGFNPPEITDESNPHGAPIQVKHPRTGKEEVY